MTSTKPSVPPGSILKISRIAKALMGSVKRHISLAERNVLIEKGQWGDWSLLFAWDPHGDQNGRKRGERSRINFSALLLPAAGREPGKPAFLQGFC